MVHEMVGGESYEYEPLGEYVVRAPGVCGGRPTYKYTSVEVSGVLSLLVAGETIEDIVAGYKGRIPREAVQEAVDIAGRHFLTGLPGLVTA